jgi:hypothetical protein
MVTLTGTFANILRTLRTHVVHGEMQLLTTWTGGGLEVQVLPGIIDILVKEEKCLVTGPV